MCRIKLAILLVVFVTTCAGKVSAQDIIFVNVANTATTQDGLSWSTAFSSLHDGLAIATPDNEVWVAEGTYTTDHSFIIKEQSKIFGGFGGFETSRSERDWFSRETVLRGAEGSETRIIYLKDRYAGTEVDGFTVTGGKAFGDDMLSGGGALYVENGYPFFRNMIFEGNQGVRGGAIFVRNSEVTFENCIFRENVALGDDGGGAVYMYGGYAEFVHSRFENNLGDKGGAAHLFMASMVSKNSVFSGNVATSFGGAVYSNYLGSAIWLYNSLVESNTSSGFGSAVYSSGDRVIIINSTIVNNTDGAGGAVSGSSGVLTVLNSILWGNTSNTGYGPQISSFAKASFAVGASLVQNGLPSNVSDMGGVIVDEPLFQGPNNFRLVPESPAIDSGENFFLDIDNDGDWMDDLTEDLDGLPRVVSRNSSPRVDMGAYEYGNITVRVEEESLPRPITPSHVYPNPFVSETTISFSLVEVKNLRVHVYDMLGREVFVSRVETLYPGENRLLLSGMNLSSGNYLYQLRTDTGRLISRSSMSIIR